MVQRAKFSAQKAYPSDLVVLGFKALAPTPAQGEAIQLGAVRLDRRTLKETASYSSLIRPSHPEAVEAKALRGSGIDPEELRAAPAPEEVMAAFEKEIFSGGEAISRARHRMIIALSEACAGTALLGALLERSGHDRGRYGERTLDIATLCLNAQGVMGLRMPGGSLDLDAQLAAFGLPRPAVRDALEEARLEAEVIRRYQQLGVERQRAYEVAALDPELLALVQDIEGRPNIKTALRDFIQQRTAAAGAPPRTLRERMLRFLARSKAARGGAAGKGAAAAGPGAKGAGPGARGAGAAGGPAAPSGGPRQPPRRVRRRRPPESGPEPRV
jgi:hypothetical protein